MLTSSLCMVLELSELGVIGNGPGTQSRYAYSYKMHGGK